MTRSIAKINILKYDKNNDVYFNDLDAGWIAFQIYFPKTGNGGNAHLYIGNYHVNQFSTFLNDLRQRIQNDLYAKGEIELVFENDMVNVDVSLFGVVALFRSSFKNITISATLPSASTPIYARFRALINAFNSWFLDFNGIRLLQVKNNKVFNTKEYEPEIVLPVLLITRSTFARFFLHTDKAWNLGELFKNVPVNELQLILEYHFKKQYANRKKVISIRNYHAIRNTVLHFQHALSWGGTHRIFIIQYLQMLSNFDLLIDAVSAIPGLNMNFENYRRQKVNSSKMLQIKQHFSQINQQLIEQPAYFVLLFSMLATRKLDHLLKTPAKNVDELYGFCNNLFLGLRELARNIVDHTQSKKGVICGRVYSGEVIGYMKNQIPGMDGKPLIDNYFSFLSLEKQLNAAKLTDEFFLDLIVFDEGQEGVIQRTISNVGELAVAKKGDNNYYLKDLEALRSGKIEFRDFFNTDDIKLYHHAIKSASHWGLIVFTNLIKKNLGIIFASTRSFHNPEEIDQVQTFDIEISKRHIRKAAFELGTFYNIILPLGKSLGFGTRVLPNIAPKENNFSAQNYFKLLSYTYRTTFDEELKSGDSKILQQFKVKDFWNSEIDANYRAENQFAELLGQKMREEAERSAPFIPVLDFDSIDLHQDQSRLLRFLAHLQLEFEVHSLIVLNIPADCIRNINETVSLHDPKTNRKNFWNANHFVLIYSFVEDSNSNRLYYADVLGGANFKEYKILKNKLASTHSTLINYKFEVGNDTFSKETEKAIVASPLFSSNNGTLQNFEMIIDHKGKTLFEWALKYTLNTRISDQKNGYFGYKITDSHFRLGSKTHISDFIYAKRVFQNSFFTDRFAFMIAKYFKENHPKVKSLTLLGYGEYSQLLINRVEKILLKAISGIQINHNMISDSEEPALIKSEAFNKSIFIIVPINTTFSTTVKIENFIQAKIDEKKLPADTTILEPSVNLLLVTHENLEKPDYLSGLNTYLASKKEDQPQLYPYKTFYWKKVDIEKRLVMLGANYTGWTKREQQYFILIASQWHLPDFCTDCFPPSLPGKINNLLTERPLLETDRTSVTPDLLLDLPQDFKSHPDLKENTIYMVPEAHFSDHVIYKGSHYLHFLEPLPFYERYKNEIAKWASGCRAKLLATMPEIFNSSILLISPSERNNTYFVELINRLVFDDSGIIIHYEVSGDYVENYQKFFSGNIRQSNFIFYVDDFIQSAKTFHLVNDFVSYCNSLPVTEADIHLHKAKNKACDGLFTLVSKADDYAKNDIISKLYKSKTSNNRTLSADQKFNAFFQLSIHSVNTKGCPLCSEGVRYEHLADNSLLDTVKHYFFNKAKNVAQRDYKDCKSHSTSWLKFHPLVEEFSTIPWISKNVRTTQLYQTFCDDNFPDKKYIKLLVQNAISFYISNDTRIRKMIDADFNGLSVEERFKETEKIFKRLNLLVKGVAPFTIWFKQFNVATKEVLDSTIDETILKVLTFQPFINIKNIKEKIFFWVLYRLDDAIDAYIAEKKLNFRKFREIKFLMRRATVLGSNFIIRKSTLDKIKQIYDMYSPARRKAIEEFRANWFGGLVSEHKKLSSLSKKLQKELATIGPKKEKDILVEISKSKLSDMIRELSFQISYIEQALNNIKYIDSSLQEFAYFFVAMTKEITIGNDAKVIKLERNVNRLIDNYGDDDKSDFYFLLRLLKFENVLVLKKGLDILFKDFFKEEKLISFQHRFGSPEVRKKLDEVLQKELGDYRLSALKKYLNITQYKDFLSFKKDGYPEYLDFIRLVYAYCSLLKANGDEEKALGEIMLDRKIKFIILNFYRIAADQHIPEFSPPDDTTLSYEDDDVHNGVFLNIKMQTSVKEIIEPKELVNIYASKKSRPKYHIENIQLDKESMNYFMINGVSGRRSNFYVEDIAYDNKHNSIASKSSYHFPKKPWTIWDLVKSERDHGRWFSRRGPVYPINRQLLEEYVGVTNLDMYGREANWSINSNFTESLFLSEDIHAISFIRLADIKMENNEIKNEGRGVITLYTDQANFNIERLKKAMILAPLITTYINKHYDSDILSFVMDQKRVFTDGQRLMHGYPKFLKHLYDQTIIPEKDRSPEFSKILYKVLSDGPKLSKLIRLHKEVIKNNLSLEVIVSNVDLKNYFLYLGLRKMSITEIYQMMDKIYKVIDENDIGDLEAVDHSLARIGTQPVYSGVDENDVVLVSEELLYVIFAEAAINAKRNKPLEGEYPITVNFYYTRDKLLMVELANHSSQIPDAEIRRILKSSVNSTHGIGLINDIVNRVFGVRIVVECRYNTIFKNQYNFSLIFPIAKQ